MKLVFASAIAALSAGIAQAEGVPSEHALFEVHSTTANLASDPSNDDEFDASYVPGFTGQGRMRIDNVMFEIQGTYTGAVDSRPDGNIADGSTSFGVIGHYILPTQSGDVGLGLGMLAGSQYDDDDTSSFLLVTSAYATNGLMVGVGYAGRVHGEHASAEPVSIQYVQAAKEFGLTERGSITLSGVAGTYMDGEDDSNGFNELSIAYNHDLSDRFAASIGLSSFNFEANGGGDGDNANGVEVTFGLSIALGGPASSARKAIGFDTPSLHRVLTWSDDVD